MWSETYRAFNPTPFLGIHNPQEFSFTVDDETDQLTLKRVSIHILCLCQILCCGHWESSRQSSLQDFRAGAVFACTGLIINVFSRINAHGPTFRGGTCMYTENVCILSSKRPPFLMILYGLRIPGICVIHTNGLSAHHPFFGHQFQAPMGAYSREYNIQK